MSSGFRSLVSGFQACRLFHARSVQTFPTRGIDEFFEKGDKQGEIAKAGRPWKAHELRLKSFDDLHKLWFILLKEKNLLLTHKERLDKIKQLSQYSRTRSRLRKVSQSMARILTVLTERDMTSDILIMQQPLGTLSQATSSHTQKPKKTQTTSATSSPPSS